MVIKLLKLQIYTFQDLLNFDLSGRELGLDFLNKKAKTFLYAIFCQQGADYRDPILLLYFKSDSPFLLVMYIVYSSSLQMIDL
jgi:hypothetical protein